MQTATPVPSLVRPETHGLAYLAKWTLRAVLQLGVMVALASRATAAPVVFDVSAQSSEGWTVSGTVTIDTAAGKVLSADLTAKDGSSTFIFDVAEGATPITTRRGGPVWTRMWFEVEFPGYGSPALVLTVPEATLVGYKGSSLVAVAIPGGYTSCIEIDANFYGSIEIPLIGSLEPQ